MTYSRENIERMQNARAEWAERQGQLVRSLFFYPFKVPAAREMMQHGVSRRLADLKHSLKRVFEIIPPDATAPSPSDLSDATAYLQAFVINIFGVVDNFAWVWALEADVREKGRFVHRSRIGFTPDHRVLRASVSERTQAYLATTDAWFGYQEGFRHALAHRIPLYIPPRALDDAGVAEFRRLEAEAIAGGADGGAWAKMLGARYTLGVFTPVMMHSYGEGSPLIRFHAQIINDLATVVEIGEHIVRDLEGLCAQPV